MHRTGTNVHPFNEASEIIMSTSTSKRNADPTITVVSLTAISKRGDVTLHFAPRDQKAPKSVMRDRAREAMRRYLARSDISYDSMTSTTVTMPSSKAQKLCQFKDPKQGTQRAALC
jgi:hypothetical protein